MPQDDSTPTGSSREISRDVAHELNNILTIMTGYAERLLTKHGNNPALQVELQMIVKNGHRAEMVIREASRGVRKDPASGD
ncbi:MAG TPA: histidine kinase dimerization/phospho-acceptor domain-containing protein [Verrucomicrobiae bacterium]